MYSYVCVHVHMSVYLHMKVKDKGQVFFSVVPYLTFETGVFHWTWSSLPQIDTELRNLSDHLPPALGCHGHLPTPSIGLQMLWLSATLITGYRCRWPSVYSQPTIGYRYSWLSTSQDWVLGECACVLESMKILNSGPKLTRRTLYLLCHLLSGPSLYNC